MKKLCIVLFILFAVSLNAEVVRTATMDSVLVENLREAVDSDGINDDEVMDFYYEKINPYDGIDEGDDYDDFRESRANYKPIDGASYFATRAFIGMLDVEIDTTIVTDTLLLNWGKGYLLDSLFTLEPWNPNTKLRYLDLDSLWVEIDNNLNPLTIGDVLFGVAFIVDNLWYYVDDSTRVELYNKLDNIAWGINEAILWDTWGGMAFFYPEYPDTLD
jgi:hypothetical protein